MLHNKILGIIGAGQLALFTARAALKHGLSFRIYANNPDEPASLEFPEQTVFGKLHDESALKEALAPCTHLVLENEFWSPEQLERIFTNQAFCPSLESYKQVYGKIEQRKLMQQLGVSQPKFAIIHNLVEAKKAYQDLGESVVLKRSTGGYDGTGNVTASSWQQLEQACAKFGLAQTQPLLLEKCLSITREIALTFFISDDHISFWPVVETLQDDHVCTSAISPADLALAEGSRLENIAKHLRSRGCRGLFTIEFFREERGDWLYNEIAPRPHNSQHLSMENCQYSQYDAVTLWVLDQALPNYIPLKSDAAMVNILGRKNQEQYQLKLPEVPHLLTLKTYMYGKKEARPGRKLGHLALLGPRELIIKEALRLSKGYEL